MKTTPKSQGILKVGHQVFGPNQHHCPVCDSGRICIITESEHFIKTGTNLAIQHYCSNCGSDFEFTYEFAPPEKLTFGFGELTDRQKSRRAPVYDSTLTSKQRSAIARTIRNHIHNDSTCEGKRPILRDIFDEAVTQFDLTCGHERQNGIVTTLITLLHRYARDKEGNPYHYLTIHDAIETRARILERTGP